MKMTKENREQKDDCDEIYARIEAKQVRTERAEAFVGMVFLTFFLAVVYGAVKFVKWAWMN
jgi:hypothetical protein